jgi:outer membrane receptor for ferrienterochelin and colicins
MESSRAGRSAFAAVAAVAATGMAAALAGPVVAPLAGQELPASVTVRVEAEGAPVEGAEVVSARDADRPAARTDAGGMAVLRLPPGSHTLRVRAFGFAPAEERLTLRAGQDTTVVVSLRSEAVELEEIIVSSTRGDRRIEDEPLRVEVITQEEVEEKLLMTPGDIAMLLAETAGIRMQPASSSLGGASVRIQGLSGRYTQILSDGLPLYGGQGGALGPLQIPPMDLGQVEVIKGAASALYGSTALGGVVNLISRRPGDEREVLLNQSTVGGTDAILWLSGEPGERWGYTMLGGVHRQAEEDVAGDGWADLPGYRRASVRPRVFWNDGRGGTLFLTAGAMAEDREGGTMPGRVAPDGGPFEEALDTRRGDLGLVGRTLLGGTRPLTVRASGMVQRHDHVFGGVRERDRHVTGFAEATLTGRDGDHAWVVGAALQRDRYAARDLPGFDFAYTVPGLFLQDEYAPVRWLTVAASGRLDAHSAYGTFFNPRLSFLLRPAEWVVRASAGTGFFAPTPFTDDTEALGLSRLEPLEGLRAERARSASLDVGREVGELELNATVFGSEIRRALRTRVDEGGRLEPFNADAPVRTWGTELLARYHAGPIHLTATHVFMRSTEPDFDQAADADAAPRLEVPLTPRHTAGVVGAWEDHDVGRFGVELYYTGRQRLERDPQRTESRPYLILGFLAERRFGPVRLFLNAENLLDARQSRHDPVVLPQRSPEGHWLRELWAPLEGRAFNGGVRFAF